MTASRKNEIIAQLVGILNELIEVDDSEEVTEISRHRGDADDQRKHRSGQGTVRTYDSQADSSRQAPLCKNRRGR